MKIYKILEGTLKTSFFLLVGDTPKEADKYIRKRIIEDIAEAKSYDGFFVTGTNEKGATRDFIWVEKFNGTPNDIAILSHELVHLVFHNFNSMGAGVSLTMDEPIAYTHSYLLEQSLNKLRKKK